MLMNSFLCIYFEKWPLDKYAIKSCKAYASFLKPGGSCSMSHFFLLGKGERLNEEKGGSSMLIIPACQICNSSVEVVSESAEI